MQKQPASSGDTLWANLPIPAYPFCTPLWRPTKHKSNRCVAPFPRSDATPPPTSNILPHQPNPADATEATAVSKYTVKHNENQSNNMILTRLVPVRLAYRCQSIIFCWDDFVRSCSIFPRGQHKAWPYPSCILPRQLSPADATKAKAVSTYIVKHNEINQIS